MKASPDAEDGIRSQPASQPTHAIDNASYTVRMATRVPVRQLQRHASELLDRVAAGERIEVTRNGQLIAVITPPDPRQQVIEELIAEGFLDPQELKKPGLAGITPLTVDLPMSPSEALQQMRDEDDR